MRSFFIDKKYIDILLVYGLILTSGSLIHNSYQKEITLLLFGISILILTFYIKKLDAHFIIYLVSMFLILFGIYLYTDGSLPLTSILGTCISLITAYIILMAVKNNFIDTYLHVITFLAAISLIGYLTDIFSLFDGLINFLPSFTESSYEGFLYAFRYTPHIDRNNSIFFEPGAYQVFLNIGLYMIFFSKTTLSYKRKIYYSIILILALFSTFSTTGFIIFSLMLGYILARSKHLSKGTKIAVTTASIILVATFSDRVQHTVIEKLSGYTEDTSLTSGIEQRRTFDALVDIEVFKANIFGQGYDRYEETFSKYSRFYDSSAQRTFDPRQGSLAQRFGGSSNGVTKTFAVYGLIFSLFIFLSYYYFFHKFIADTILRVLSFMMLILFFIGEAYVFMPISLSLIAAIFVYRYPRVENSSELTTASSRIN